MTSGAVQRFSVGEVASDDTSYLELDSQSPAEPPGRPSRVLWKTKVFSALGGTRGGQVDVTRSARHTALLDVIARLRVFDRAGITTEESRIEGRQPAIRASRTQDLIVAASSDAPCARHARLPAARLRCATSGRRISTWRTDGIFFAVADFFRGVSLFDETLSRFEYVETDTMSLSSPSTAAPYHGRTQRGDLAVYDAHGAPLGAPRTRPLG